MEVMFIALTNILLGLVILAVVCPLLFLISVWQLLKFVETHQSEYWRSNGEIDFFDLLRVGGAARLKVVLSNLQEISMCDKALSGKVKLVKTFQFLSALGFFGSVVCIAALASIEILYS